MNASMGHRNSDQRHAAEAERWFVRMLDPDCATTERAAFERWYAANPAHARRYDEVARLWIATDVAASQPALKAEADAALVPQRPAARRWYVPALAAAALAACVVAGGLGWRLAVHGTSQAPVRYATTTGELRAVRLPDGSSMLLDTDSVAAVDYRARHRDVTLVRGRALFDVRHDAARPFQVHVGQGTITDVGTVFQVSDGAQGAEVVLVRGAVSVSAYAHGALRSVAMVPQQQVHIASTGVISAPRKVPLSEAVAWTRGDIVASDWQLSRLIRAMNRYSPTELLLGESALGGVRISGVFHAGDQQSLIRMLELGWSIQAHPASPHGIVLTRNGAATAHPKATRDR
jgi:transmembrane sensor